MNWLTRLNFERGMYKELRGLSRTSSNEQLRPSSSPDPSAFARLTMRLFDLLSFLSVFSLATFVAGLGTSCSAPVTKGTAAASAPFWMEQIQHRGSAPFSGNPGGYQVFRNVKVGAFLALAS